ncbi:MAG TPA: transketolase C-terminal domain-containing protein [Dehalococcoidia bacterium]|nr:transketolase C-terminal domain-containing protein [Dehalococcoidia bacterium]
MTTQADARPAAATREAYGPTLIKLAEAGHDIVALDADLSASTGGNKLRGPFPDRWYTVGAAEANMVGMAAGLAAAGKTAFAASFAVFMPGHCFDQIRISVVQPKLNVKLVASHGGVSVGEDGASAQAIEDLALMTSLPGLTVVVPADVVEAEKAIWAAATTDGPFYIRVGRPKIPVIHDDAYEFQVGKAQTLRQGNDVTIIACGLLVSAAAEAAEKLSADGIGARVLNMATIKPLDEAAVLAAARETGAIVTAEEHSVIGGLGSAVTRTLALHEPTPVEMVGVQDRFGESGKWSELLERHGLTASGVEDAARRVLARK